MLLSALSCVTLGVLLVAVAPRGWLKVGIVAMAAVDAYLVGTQLLQPANDVLNAAAPPAHLPQLQRALFGDALIGYGDLFVAGVFGAIVAAEQRARRPRSPAVALGARGARARARLRPAVPRRRRAAGDRAGGARAAAARAGVRRARNALKRRNFARCYGVL